MGTFYNSRIVKEGLVLCLDAGNRKSYPGSGTVWTDLSGNEKHATLVNSPAYNTINSGNFSLDGANDHINIAHYFFPLNAFTYDIWIKPSLNDTLKIFWMSEMQIFFNTSSKSIYTRWYNNDTTARDYQQSFTQNYNSLWTNICWTIGSLIDIVYINGKSVAPNRNTTIQSPIITGFNGLLSGIFIGRDEQEIYLPFGVASVKIYNRALSTSEILQNFNATRGRFDI